MLYTKATIKELYGFDNVDDFVEDFMKRTGSQGYCIKYRPDGVWIAFDYDTCPGMPNYGCISEE